MKILILGSGGREHAIFLKLKESKLAEEIFILPGNAGSLQNSRIPNIQINDFEGILKVTQEKRIELIFVGPEVPLALGIKDFFIQKAPDILVFGPDKLSAQLEASKAFAYEFMAQKNIPTPESHVVSELSSSIQIVKESNLPFVIKADGLAAGKGVSIHKDHDSGIQQLHRIFEDKLFGSAGDKVLIQKFLQGKEASLFAILNGKEALYLPTARDYKAIGEGNTGPNTGGMGAFSPGDLLHEEHIDFIHKNIVEKVLKQFSYTGILYIGLMVHSQKAEDLSVVEFNCRLGDPETQSILPMIETDILPYILWSCGARDYIPKIAEKSYFHLPQKFGSTVNVVIAAKGYPNKYEKEIEIYLPKKVASNIHIVHAGTKEKEGRFISSGGRIMNIVGYGKDKLEARKICLPVSRRNGKYKRFL